MLCHCKQLSNAIIFKSTFDIVEVGGVCTDICEERAMPCKSIEQPN